jgi:hypothetical protein
MATLTKVERGRLRARILELLRRQPDRSAYSIARELDTTVATVTRTRRRAASDPLEDAAELVEPSPMQAVPCSCERPWSNGERGCVLCGRSLRFDYLMHERQAVG